MKKRYTTLFILGLAGIFAMGIFLIHNGAGDSSKHGPVRPASPRIANLGPYGTNVSTTEQLGDCTFQMRAEKLFLKKGKTFGFENSLLKKAAAKGLSITVWKNEKKLLSLYKDYLETAPNLKHIRILQPRILYPETISRPDSVIIDKEKMSVTLMYGNKKEVWQLN